MAQGVLAMYDSQDRFSDILEMIGSLAKLDFSKQLPVKDDDTVEDSIASGLNILAEELKHSVVSKKELEEKRKLIETIVENIPVGIFLKDANDNFKITLWNKAAEDIFEVPRESVLGKTTHERWPKELADLYQADDVRVTSNKVHVDIPEEPSVTESGRQIFLHTRKVPIKMGEEEERSFLLGVCEDISIAKKVKEDLANLLAREKEAHAEAARANLAKDTFLATLSHELRTPLTGIILWSELIRQSGFDVKKLEKGLLAIEQSARTQWQMIEDLIDVSRIQSGKLVLNPSEVEPGEVVRRALESVQILTEKRSIRIESQIDTELGRVLADSIRLQQIVWNLLSNAIKFSQQNGVIRVFVKRQKGESRKPVVSIQVIDEGKGIRPDFLPEIFNRFAQEDSTTTRTHGGLGIGLAIVRDLVRRQGGKVTAESAGEGKGATFTVQLPIIVGSRASNTEFAASSENSNNNSNPGTNDLAGLKLLVVDDDPGIVEVFVATLTSYGAKVFTASSSAGALSALAETKPDILVSDIAMPGEDGYSLIHKVRMLSPERGGQIPALALTAYVSEEDAARARSAGFNEYLAKPFEVRDLALVLSRLAKNLPGARPLAAGSK